MPTKKRHHYLPKTYLRGFSYDNDRDHVFRYHKKTKSIDPVNIESICTKNKFYETVDSSGKPSEEIESDFFANIIEPLYPELIKKVAEKEILNNSDIADLAIQIALQFMRLPTTYNVIEQIAEKSYIEQQRDHLSTYLDGTKPVKNIDTFLQAHPEIQEERVLRYISKLVSGEVKISVKVPKNNIIKAWLTLSPQLADTFCKMKWQFMFAPKGSSFLTSDMPVVVIAPVAGGWQRIDYGGFKLPNSITIFPLNSRVCVFLTHDKYSQNFHKITKDQVRTLNLILSELFEYYLISDSSKLLASVTRKDMQGVARNSRD